MDHKTAFCATLDIPATPQVIVVGPLENNRAILAINKNIRYSFDSVVNAMDACFKCFWALHCGYPVDIAHVWIFIERFVYQLHETSSVGYVNDLIADLNRIQ